MVLIQRRSKSRWIADDNGGGVRYLAGVLRDGMGRYLSLCSSDGLSDAEIGRMLNMPAPTAKTYFYRALPHLRGALASSTHVAAVS